MLAFLDTCCFQILAEELDDHFASLYQTCFQYCNHKVLKSQPHCGFNIFKPFSPSFNLMFPICFPHLSNMWTAFCRFSQGFTDFNWLNWQVAELDAQRDRLYQRQGPGRLAARSDGKSTRRGETMGWWELMFHFCIIWWNSGNIILIYIYIMIYIYYNTYIYNIL